MYIVGEEEGNIYTGESSQTTMATDGANFYGESSETEPVGTSADSPSLTIGNADTDALSRFPTASPQDTENPSSASTESGGGGWLAGLTNAAGLVAMLPIPEVAAAAGLVNAAGEALQGHWVAAGIGVGTAVLAVVGLGVLGKVLGRAAESGTEVVQRAMSTAELASTESTGLLRGGRSGTHYVSDAVNSSAGRAQQRLALPQTPQVRVTMEVPVGRFSPPSRIKPAFNMPGGGMERTAVGDIPVNILRVDEY